jgi:hypothetical protein
MVVHRAARSWRNRAPVCPAGVERTTFGSWRAAALPDSLLRVPVAAPRMKQGSWEQAAPCTLPVLATRVGLQEDVDRSRSAASGHHPTRIARLGKAGDLASNELSQRNELGTGVVTAP